MSSAKIGTIDLFEGSAARHKDPAMFERAELYIEKPDNQILLAAVLLLFLILAGNFLQWNLHAIVMFILYIFFSIFLLLVVITAVLLVINFIHGNRPSENQ